MNDTAKADETLDAIDCLNRNMARLRPDIRKIIREEFETILFSTLKEEAVRCRERCW